MDEDEGRMLVELSCCACGGQDESTHRPGCPRSFEPRRLNPRCPVCGEDEPKFLAYESWDASLASRIEKGKLPLECRRCAYCWYIEPLSKPWEEKDA